MAGGRRIAPRWDSGGGRTSPLDWALAAIGCATSDIRVIANDAHKVAADGARRLDRRDTLRPLAAFE